MLQLLTVITLLLGLSAPLLAQVCPPNLPPPVAPDSRYSVAEPVSGQIVVTDIETGLMWKQCPEGLTGAGCASGSLNALTWSAALAAANASSHAGYSDWRLPSNVELHSLAETSCRAPAINTRLFPRNGSSVYWTSSTYAPDASFAWGVDFSVGFLNASVKGGNQRIRLVRGGQQIDHFNAASDFTPDNYSFTAQTDAPLSDLRTSNIVTVSGIDTPVGIGVSGAADSAYSINDGPFGSTPGVVVNGDNVVVRHTSAAAPLVSVTTTLRIGAQTADFVSTTAVPTYTVGGTLSGLASGASVVLQNNGSDNLTLGSDGEFTFATALDDLSAYAVTVLTQPSNPSQTCTVTAGEGSVAGANVTSVAVNCVTNTYTVGGNLTGLAVAAAVVLRNNNGDDLTLTTNGNFTFATALNDLSPYLVTVFNQPTGPSQTCTVTAGGGNLAGANVSNVNVSCVTNTYTVGGSLSGLASGTSVILQNNGGDDLPLSDNGNFTFGTVLPDLSAYLVTVLSQPSNPGQTCTVNQGTGVLAGANITNVSVNCVINTYTVSPSASAGGTIDPATPQTVTHGQTAAFTLAADNGFYLGAVTGSCGGTLVGNLYTTAPITADCTVQAQFAAQITSTSTLLASANPVRTGQLVSFDVTVSGSSAPEDGQVTVTASTGESCTDDTPQVTGNSASFGCPITFATLGPRTLTASFSDSVTHLDNSSAPLNFSVARFADLSVSISDGQSTIKPGQPLSYLIEVRNAGPDEAPGSELMLASVPALLSSNWTCTVVGAAACPAASGSGELGETFDLPAGAGLDFVQNGTATTPLNSSLSVGVELSASAVTPNFVFDQVNGNNQASDVNLTERLFADGFEQ